MLQAPEWDEEAIEEAEYQARALESFDPDAASDLRAMAASARRKLTGQVPGASTREPYDPMKIYARMAKYYGWSFEQMQNMHFITFFAFVREASEMNEEEKREIERNRRGQGTTTVDQAQGLFPEAQAYQGETVTI